MPGPTPEAATSEARRAEVAEMRITKMTYHQIALAPGVATGTVGGIEVV